MELRVATTVEATFFFWFFLPILLQNFINKILINFILYFFRNASFALKTFLLTFPFFSLLFLHLPVSYLLFLRYAFCFYFCFLLMLASIAACSGGRVIPSWQWAFTRVTGRCFMTSLSASQITLTFPTALPLPPSPLIISSSILTAVHHLDNRASLYRFIQCTQLNESLSSFSAEPIYFVFLVFFFFISCFKNHTVVHWETLKSLLMLNTCSYMSHVSGPQVGRVVAGLVVGIVLISFTKSGNTGSRVFMVAAGCAHRSDNAIRTQRETKKKKKKNLYRRTRLNLN